MNPSKPDDLHGNKKKAEKQRDCSQTSSETQYFKYLILIPLITC